MIKLYVASSLNNKARAKQIITSFEKYDIQITYDWTIRGQVFDKEELLEIGLLEEKGVIECDIFLMVFPGRSGAHFEFGLARGLNKHIVLLEEVEVEQKTFYHLPGIVCLKTEKEVIEHILKYDILLKRG